MKYPNPCDTCIRCVNLRGCDRWLTRYRYRQKQINAFAEQLMRPKTKIDNSKFRYEHPDVVRRYLKHGPCEQCKVKDLCDTPCAAYWNWWDAKMEWLGRKFQ